MKRALAILGLFALAAFIAALFIGASTPAPNYFDWS